MNCKKCGNLIKETDIICSVCGESVIQNNPEPAAINQPEAMNFNQPTMQNNNIPGMQMPQNNQEPAAINEPETMNFNQPTIQNNNMPGMQIPQNNPEPAAINEPKAMNFNQPTMQNNNIPGMQIPQNNPEPAAINEPEAMNFNQPTIQNNNIPGMQMSQNNAINNYNQPQKKKMSPFIIIVIVMVAIIGVLGAVILIRSLSNFIPNSNNNNNNNNDTPIADSVNDSDNTNTNTNTYEYLGFNLIIPENYVAITEEKLLLLTNKKDKIAVAASMIAGATIEDANNELEEIKKGLTEQGYKINNTETKKYNNTDWLIFDTEYTEEGTTYKIYLTFCQLGSYHVATNEIMNVGKRSNESIFQELTEMYEKANYKGSNNFSPNEKEDILNLDVLKKQGKLLLEEKED